MDAPAVPAGNSQQKFHKKWKTATWEKKHLKWLLNLKWQRVLWEYFCFHFFFFDNQNERLISLQLEVDGRTTTRKLDNLVSQTEYGLAVTPVYDEGSAEPMLGEAITGKSGNLL